MTPAEKVASGKTPKTNKWPYQVVWRCRVKEFRTALGLSQRDVEKATGVSSAGVTQIEAGRDVTLWTARRLAAFFGKTVEELWPSEVEG